MNVDYHLYNVMYILNLYTYFNFGLVAIFFFFFLKGLYFVKIFVTYNSHK